MLLRKFAVSIAMFAAFAGAPVSAETPGVSESEIKIGATFPFSGPASPLSNTGKGLIAYVHSINDRGGINGRKINLITYDDAYSPPKAVEQTRKLIESDEVAFLFGPLGTPGIGATIKYVNAKKVPHLFVVSGVTKFANFNEFPQTTTGLPSYSTEGKIYAKYIAQTAPDAKIAILYQNDDLGKDFVAGTKDVLGERFATSAVVASHEVTDPTIDSQIVALRGANPDVLISGTTAKFCAQSIRKIYELGWKPMHFIASGAASLSSTIVPVGLDKAQGTISSAYVKDVADPAWANDPGVKEFLAFMEKYFPDGNPKEGYNLYAYMVANVLKIVLEQCKGNFSRDTIMAQANNLKDVYVPTLLPGIKVNTSPTNHHPLRQLQLQRIEGPGWLRFGEVIEGANL